MALTFVTGAHNEAGGIGLSVSITTLADIPAGSLVVATVTALENTRGWSAIINGTGSKGLFTDLFTGGVSLSGVLQYVLDSGSGQREFWWMGAYVTGALVPAGTVYTFNCTASPAAGVGVAGALVAYTNLGGSFPIYSSAVTIDVSGATPTTNTAPSSVTPAGSTGTFTFTIDQTTAGFTSAATFVLFGDTGDFHVLCVPIGLGGIGHWLPPAALTARVTAGGAGGPWYMTTMADGPTSGGAFLGRLPLLGAG